MERIAELRKEENTLYREMTRLAQRIHDIHNEMKKIMAIQPECCCCGRRAFPDEMTRVTQEDIDAYIDSGEGYGSPVLGEYYCGC